MATLENWPEKPETAAFEKEWLLPGEALRLVAEVCGDNHMAVTEILKRAAVGRVVAAGLPQNDPDIEAVHPKMWAWTDDAVPSGRLWAVGSASFSISDQNIVIEYFSMRFEPVSIRAICAGLSRAPERAETAAAALPALPPDKQHITEEEHGSWYTPAQALARLPRHWEIDVKLSALARPISDGIIRTAARDVRAIEKKDSYFILPPPAFEKWAYLADSKFWQSGNYLHFMRDRTGYAGYRDYEMRAYDVRLEPREVDRLASTHSPDRAAPVPDDVRASISNNVLNNVPAHARNVPGHSPVTDAEVKAWHAALPPGDQNLAVRKLRTLARDHFAPRRVAKNLTEQFGVGRPLGRRPKGISNGPKD